jgi:hypothetical protein
MHWGLFVDRGSRRPDLDSFAFGVVIDWVTEMGGFRRDSITIPSIWSLIYRVADKRDTGVAVDTGHRGNEGLETSR